MYLMRSPQDSPRVAVSHGSSRTTLCSSLWKNPMYLLHMVDNLIRERAVRNQSTVKCGWSLKDRDQSGRLSEQPESAWNFETTHIFIYLSKSPRPMLTAVANSFQSGAILRRSSGELSYSLSNCVRKQDLLVQRARSCYEPEAAMTPICSPRTVWVLMMLVPKFDGKWD